MTLIPSVRLKRDQPETMRETFEEFIRAYPEASCDHPEHTEADEWVAMDKAEFDEWVRTGQKPEHLMIV